MLYLPPSPPHSLCHSIPVYPFPTEHFPLIMQNAIRYLQDGGKNPAELAANAVLVAVSLACQSDVHVLNSYTQIEGHCALNILTLADSGMGKSTIVNQTMKPFVAFRERLAAEYPEKVAAWQKEFFIWKTKHKALNSNLLDAFKKNHGVDEALAAMKCHPSIGPDKPILPTLVYNDASHSALVVGLEKYPYAGLISDEASNIFDHRLNDILAFLNKVWDGDVYDYKRSNREPISIKPTLTVSLMLQPSLFLDYMKKSGGKALDSGFLSRFLFTNIYPSNPLGTGMMSHRHNPNTPHRDEAALACFHAQIDKLLEKQKIQNYSGCTDKKVLKLSSDAESYWETLRDSWVALTLPGNVWYYIKPMVLKANTNTLRIAGLLSYFSDQEADIISLDALTKAAAIMVWYLNHTASWFYQFTEEYKFQQDIYELHQWIYQRFISNNCMPFKKNDVIKYGPNKFRRSDKLEPLLHAILNTGSILYCRSNANSAVYITLRMSTGGYAPLIENLGGPQFPPLHDI
ncbi:DUF3987 domain-containing protein [Citrobacter sp. RHBSTW-00271]|uniref:DUF3987 domain-containing protein n=1 Tax=Citrobacter sp. RHBSTW-00271 TaxID=2742642 RepID=UPI0015F96B91|nr:DUF3987 domain-containing protein [Citrobacter sp. RHBSTW-00271]MBA7942498.1 DUF3987 domain-containing protein [Citrobacter sp. RHBSTW-00271]